MVFFRFLRVLVEVEMFVGLVRFRFEGFKGFCRLGILLEAWLGGSGLSWTRLKNRLASTCSKGGIRARLRGFCMQRLLTHCRRILAVHLETSLFFGIEILLC